MDKSFKAPEKTNSELSLSSNEANGREVSLPQAAQNHDTILATIRKRPKALLWCGSAIWILVVSAYTNTAGNSILGIPRFRQDFGRLVDGHYVLPADWQAAFYGGGSAAAILGTFCAASTADAFGRKPALALLLLVKLVSITLEVVVTTNAVYFAALVLGGLSCGGFTGTVVTYVGETAPLRLRGILTAAVPIAFCSGSLVVSILIKCTGEKDSRWAYRSTFVSQYGFAGIAVIIISLMPETPYWLINSGKHEKAISAFKSLSYSGTEAKLQVEEMLRTLANSSDETSGTTYLECFRNSNLRRTIISVMPMSIQALSGVSFVSLYSTYYQQLAGYTTETSFYLFIVQVVLSLIGIICSLFLIDRVGRRNLTIWGMSFLTVTLVFTGGLAVADTPGTIKGTVGLLLLYCYVYNLTIGATAYSLSAEVATAKLRAKTASLTFALQGALFSMWGLVLPYLFNPDKANLGAKVTFIFGGLSVVSTVYLWLYQPEVAGRSYEELDEMFRRRLPARKFKGYRRSSTPGYQTRTRVDALEIHH